MPPRREQDDNAPLSDYERYLLLKLFKAGGEIPPEFWASVRSKMEVDGPRLLAADLSGIKGEERRLVGASGEPAFGGAWVNYDSFRPAAFWKDVLGIVHLEGIIKDGAISTTAFTLPAGYRPPGSNCHFPASAGGYAELIVDSAGVVMPSIAPGGFLYFSLYGISFRAA